MINSRRVPIIYLLKQIKYDLLGVLIICTIAEFFIVFYKKEIPGMPWNVPALLGTAISILLSFKMAQSYDRWWEARKIWGAIVNDSRNLILNANLYVKDQKVVNQIAELQIMWCFRLADGLKSQSEKHDFEKDIILHDMGVKIGTHVPLSISERQIDILKKERANHNISDFGLYQMTKTINQLIDSMGKGERIKKTVFPSGYRYILHISIYVFLVMLSIAMKDIELPFHIPLLFIMSCIFFMLEKSAFNLQDPFDNHITDVPVYTISNTIANNILELIGSERRYAASKYQYKFYEV